jgi:predicted DNA-binding protein
MGRDWREVKRNYVQQPIYLLPETAELLRQLTATTRIPKAVLLREAVDDLLVKYKDLLAKPQKRKP